jgi:hypothetical protein
LDKTEPAASQTIGSFAGKQEIKYEFVSDSLKPGAGANVHSMWTVDKRRQGVSPRPQPFSFSADEGVDVGADHETMVSNDYQPGKNKFTGKIVSVTMTSSHQT